MFISPKAELSGVYQSVETPPGVIRARSIAHFLTIAIGFPSLFYSLSELAGWEEKIETACGFGL
jgi:hypothetical protein